MLIIVVLSACFQTERAQQFAGKWYYASSPFLSPVDAPHGYFEIYYLNEDGKQCVVDSRARTLRDLGNDCIIYPTDSERAGHVRVQCAGRAPLSVVLDWNATLENSPKRIAGYEELRARAQRQPHSSCVVASKDRPQIY